MCDPHITWRDVLARPQDFSTFEDPINGGMVDLQQFYGAYRAVLDDLDGRDLMSYVDFFFSRNPMVAGHWSFTDEDAQEDFYAMCLEMGCSRTREEIQEGESAVEKAARKSKEQAGASSKPHKKPQAMSTPKHAASRTPPPKTHSHPFPSSQSGKKGKGGKMGAKDTGSGDTSKSTSRGSTASAKTTAPREKHAAETSTVPPPLVDGVEHASKRALVTAFYKKYGPGDKGRRAVHRAETHARDWQEFESLVPRLERPDLPASERKSIEDRLDELVVRLEHSI